MSLLILDPEQKQFFDDNGYLLLKGFYGPAEMEQMRRRNRAARARRPQTNRQLSAWVRASRLTALDTLPVPDPGLNGNTAPTKPSEQPWLQPSLRRGIMR